MIQLPFSNRNKSTNMLRPQSASLALALRDVWNGLCCVHIWPMLGWQDIKQRYRRGVIGPFWLTISYGVMIAGMGPLYGGLLRQDIGTYLPYLATSFVVWTLISGTLIDSCNAFIGSEGYIKQVKLPLTVYVFRVVWRNLLIFAHNVLIIIIVLLIYPAPLSWFLLLVPLGVLLIGINGIWVGLLLGLLCARFRDLPQVVTSLVQLAFFLTPVMWRPEMMRGRSWVTDMNPLYHLMEIVRAPLISNDPAASSWKFALILTVVGFLLTLLVFKRYRSRIAYWV